MKMQRHSTFASGEKTVVPPDLPMKGPMRLDEVLVFYQVSEKTLFKQIAAGIFPQPTRIGGIAYWDAIEVRRFLKNAGANVCVPE